MYWLQIFLINYCSKLNIDRCNNINDNDYNVQIIGINQDLMVKFIKSNTPSKQG